MPDDVDLAHIDLAHIDDDGLVRLFGRLMRELRERGVVRTANNPIADIAERLVADYYDGHVAPSNERDYDVLTKAGDRLQVKALRRTQKGRSTLSALRGHGFTALVAVVFGEDFTVQEAFFIPLEVVEEYQRWSTTWKAHRLSLTKRLCADSRVTRVDAAELLGTSAC